MLVSNHVGWADPLWIGFALWPRPICPMAKQELFSNRFLGILLRDMGAFPVNRGAPTPSSIKLPAEILRNKGIVVIFPGGTREAQISGVKRGAATIALLADVPVVPVFFRGPPILRLRDMLFRRPEVLVQIGTPIYPDNKNCLTKPDRKEQTTVIVDAIELKLNEMIQQ